MEIKNLIDRLDDWGGVEAIYNGGFVQVNYHGIFRLVEEAATALEQLQAENDRFKRERDAAVIDMTALAEGHCCDLCAVEYCIVRGKTEMCATFKWLGPKEE